MCRPQPNSPTRPPKGDAAIARKSDAPAPAPLSELEQREALARAENEKRAEDALQACYQQVLNATQSQAIEAQHNLQIAYLKLQIATLERQLAKERHRHGCPDCEYSRDGKFMAKP